MLNILSGTNKVVPLFYYLYNVIRTIKGEIKIKRGYWRSPAFLYICGKCQTIMSMQGLKFSNMNEVEVSVARKIHQEVQEKHPEVKAYTYVNNGEFTVLFFHSHPSLQKSMNMAYRLINYPCKR